MPGMSFVYSKAADLDEREPAILARLDSLVHYPNYEKRVLMREKDALLACTRHEKYPVTVFEIDGLFVCVEGFLYGKSRDEVARELREIAKLIFAKGRDYRTELSRWMLDTDGDFLVFMRHKESGEFCIINDALARLPFYYFKSDDTLIASREPRFIAGLAGKCEFDRDAISQYLLLGYPLGDKTVFKNILQMGPASVMRGGGVNAATRIERIHGHSFEPTQGAGKSIKEHARELTDLLQVACRNRFDPQDTSVMALSGGMDSRMVLSCLAKMGFTPPSATFFYASYVNENEIAIAEQVANALGSEWKLFRIGAAKGEDVLELLRIKNGLNFLGMSFSMPLFRVMKEAFGGRITLITGDGGDKVLRDIRPAGRIKNIDVLVDYVINHNQLMPVDVVSSLTKTDARDIVESLRRHLQSFDERDMVSKYVHFLISERCMKWNFQGEDRNRFAFWPVAPIFAVPLFVRAMKVPFGLKSRYRLFREMLLIFSPEAARIRNALWDLPVTSKKLWLYFSAREAYLHLPPRVKRLVRPHRGHRGGIAGCATESDVMRCFLDQLKNCGAVSDYLSVDAVRKSLPHIEKMGFDHLFTLTSTIEDFTSPRSTIEDYSERELI